MSLRNEIDAIRNDNSLNYDEKLARLQKIVTKVEAVMLLGQNPKEQITLRDSLGGLAPLYLIIEKKWFDKILSGEKKEEYRTIDMINIDVRYTYMGADGRRYLKPYDRLRLCVGYHKNRDEAIVEVVGIEADNEMVTYKLGRILDYKPKEKRAV